MLLRTPAADLPPEAIGVEVQGRAYILEGEQRLTVPALDPLLGLPAEQAGRESPGVPASFDASDRICKNRKRKPDLPPLGGLRRQRRPGARLLAVRAPLNS